LEYPDLGYSTDGLFADLPLKLAHVIPFDHISVAERATSKRVTLWFRSGAKRLFHIHLIRKSGRYLIETGGVDAGHVLRSIQICRDHCDRFFGINTLDVISYEGATRSASHGGTVHLSNVDSNKEGL